MPDESNEQIINNPSGGNGGAGKTMDCKECGSVHYATGDFDLKKVSTQRRKEREKLDEVDAKDAEIARLKAEIETRDASITELRDKLRDSQVSGGTGDDAASRPFFLKKGA